MKSGGMIDFPHIFSENHSKSLVFMTFMHVFHILIDDTDNIYTSQSAEVTLTVASLFCSSGCQASR